MNIFYFCQKQAFFIKKHLAFDFKNEFQGKIWIWLFLGLSSLEFGLPFDKSFHTSTFAKPQVFLIGEFGKKSFCR